MRDFNTVQEQEIKWGIKSSRIIQLLLQGRIPEAYKLGRIWCIPNTAPDPRKARGWEKGKKRK